MKIDHVSAVVENGAAYIFAVLFNKLSVRLNDHVQPNIAAPCRRDHRNDIAERGQVAKLLKDDIRPSRQRPAVPFRCFKQGCVTLADKERRQKMKGCFSSGMTTKPPLLPPRSVQYQMTYHSASQSVQVRT